MSSSFERNLGIASDIREHLGLLHGLAMSCDQVVELGFRTGVSTSALLASGAKVRSYDTSTKCRPHVKKLAAEYPKTFEFKLGDSREVEPIKCDMLFIDSDHTYECAMAELLRWAPHVGRWIALHDTETCPGVMKAVREFISCTHERVGKWAIRLRLPNNNGMTILRRLM